MPAVVELDRGPQALRRAARAARRLVRRSAKGQVVAIIGRSGSGKSTALRCIDRLETIDGGRIDVCGHAVHDPALDVRALRRDVGIVFQSYNLFPHLTVVQNITLA